LPCWKANTLVPGDHATPLLSEASSEDQECCARQRYRLIRGRHARKRDSGFHKTWISTAPNPRGWCVIPTRRRTVDEVLFENNRDLPRTSLPGTKLDSARCAEMLDSLVTFFSLFAWPKREYTVWDPSRILTLCILGRDGSSLWLCGEFSTF
jgi:hypothetical protein